MSIIQSVRVGVAGVLRRYCSWRLLFPVFLGVLFGFGDEVSVRRGRLDCYSLTLYGKMLVFAVLFAVMFALVERLAHILTERERLDARPTFMFDWSPASIMVGFAGIAVCWLPYLVLLFPGVYWSDTSRQLVMYYGGEPIMDQHPFFDTYLFGWFADLGQLVFSNRLLGLYLLIVIQCFGMAALFSVMTSYIKRVGAPQWLCWTVYAVVSLFPLFPIMFSSLAKDTINALFVVPFMMLVAEIVRSQGSCLRRPGLAALLVVDSLLMCLTKKTCVYIVVAALLALCAIRFGAKLRLFLAGTAAALVAVMFALIPNVVFPLLSIEPGGKQEMIPFIAQQLAHDLKYESESFSDEDRAIIDGFFEYDSTAMGERYEPFQADAVKGNFSRGESSLTDVLGLWLRKTVEHPGGHLEAWLGISQGWISFHSKGDKPGYLLPYFSSNWYDERVTSYMQWPEETTLNRTVQIVYQSIQSVPVVNVLFFRSTWATVLPFLLCYMACGLRRGERKRAWLVLTPLLVSTATLFIAGVSGTGGEPTRYVFTSMIMIPVVAGFLLRQQRECATDMVEA